MKLAIVSASVVLASVALAKVQVDTIQIQNHIVPMDQICQRGDTLETKGDVIGTVSKTIPGDCRAYGDGSEFCFREPRTVEKSVNFGRLSRSRFTDVNVCTFRFSGEDDKCMDYKVVQTSEVLSYTVKTYDESADGTIFIRSEETHSVHECL